MGARRTARRIGGAAVAAGALVGAVWIADQWHGRSAGQPSSFVIVLIDTLRPDHLSVYGYARDTSPRLASIAARGFVFDRFVTVSPWTNPTIAGLFTGRYPQAILPPAAHAEAIRQRLPDGVTTLAEALQRAGYRTAAFVDHPGISPEVNYDQGFDDYGFLRAGWTEWVGASEQDVLAEVSRQLDAVGAAPYLYYLHLVYPHAPYHPPAGFAGRFGPGFETPREAEREGMINRYDEEILFSDRLLGKIFDQLDGRGLTASTWVFVLSDHGEGFWEHGMWEHGNTLFDELLRVPLIVHPPGGWPDGPRRIDDPLSVVDLYPTILELAGLRPQDGLDGISFAGRLSAAGGVFEEPRVNIEADDRHRFLFSESPHSNITHGVAIRTDRFKLSYTPAHPINDRTSLMAELRAGRDTALYDLTQDPGETRDVRAEQPSVAHGLAVRLALHWERGRSRRRAQVLREVDLDPEILDRLEALGYGHEPRGEGR
jgi:arylsulfatase A-like enzyme